MVIRMRIDASNLILAAQAQTRPAAPAKAAQPAFEPVSFEAKPVTGGKPAAASGSQRLGQKLDIKV